MGALMRASPGPRTSSVGRTFARCRRAAIMQTIFKYPRTHHIQGSRLQPGDEDLSQVPFSFLKGKHLVVEAKLDGANCGISFTPDGQLLIQSRGHYLTGGSAFEAQFDRVKAWAQTLRGLLWELLGSRYVMYGEVMQKKHTVWYDRLPHLFLEFDVYDKEADLFLSTEMRRILFEGTPVVSVPVLHEGTVASLTELTGMVGRALYKSDDWRAAFEETVRAQGLDVARAWTLTDPSDLEEGLYLKWEEDGRIVRWLGDGRGGKDAEARGEVMEGRYKWVRADFHQRILEANEQARGHVGFQPMIPNLLAPGVDLFTF
jgi:hypothetical protein